MEFRGGMASLKGEGEQEEGTDNAGHGNVNMCMCMARRLRFIELKTWRSRNYYPLVGRSMQGSGGPRRRLSTRLSSTLMQGSACLFATLPVTFVSVRR
ncbi:hypothetical protein BC936DRAFT_138113 [Jimgerdemannia flammicorona]|uniref:Uncharacterized protein n=1 Tax=Jimgerdemannia flammicorona TaxID=994334 RepID=A0A433CW78_9FUNG|nr:hypothetical protein BC936DRAFT_138113 [Jimgerdemannia flammicorona]